MEFSFTSPTCIKKPIIFMELIRTSLERVTEKLNIIA
jgi:hypothetical protein